MQITILQHADTEHRGSLRQFLIEDGHQMQAINLHRGDALPLLAEVEVLWVMGGPMDVCQEDQFPWLAEEKRFIRAAVAGRGLPFLGVCLGHQLLADALGGKVGKGGAEVGVLPVSYTEAGMDSLFFDGIEGPIPVLQWNGAEVQTPP